MMLFKRFSFLLVGLTLLVLSFAFRSSFFGHAHESHTIMPESERVATEKVEVFCSAPVLRRNIRLSPYPVREGEKSVYGFDALWQTIWTTDFIEGFLDAISGHETELGISWATREKYENDRDDFTEQYSLMMNKILAVTPDSSIPNESGFKMSSYGAKATTVYQFHYYNAKLGKIIYLPIEYVEEKETPSLAGIYIYKVLSTKVSPA